MKHLNWLILKIISFLTCLKLQYFWMKYLQRKARIFLSKKKRILQMIFQYISSKLNEITNSIDRSFQHTGLFKFLTMFGIQKIIPLIFPRPPNEVDTVYTSLITHSLFILYQCQSMIVLSLPYNYSSMNLSLLWH